MGCAAHRVNDKKAMPGPRAEIAQACAGTMLRNLLKVRHLPFADQIDALHMHCNSKALQRNTAGRARAIQHRKPRSEGGFQP